MRVAGYACRGCSVTSDHADRVDDVELDTEVSASDDGDSVLCKACASEETTVSKGHHV